MEDGFLTAAIDKPWQVGVVSKDIAIGAGGQGFDSQAGQIGHRVADCSSLLSQFSVA